MLATAPRVTAYARSLLGNAHDAEDIVQDFYCRLIAKAGTYDLSRDGLKLLFTAISNACINLKTRRKPTFSLTRSDSTGHDRTEDPSDDRAASPAEVAVGNELERAIAGGLKRLPAQQRAAVELKALGYAQTEIAAMLSTTATKPGC